MSLLHLIILLFSLLFTSSSCALPGCTIEQQFAISHCNIIVSQIKGFIFSNFGSSDRNEFYGRVRELCHEIKSCLGPYQCKEAQSANVVLQQGCDMHLFLMQENRDCFREFLGEVFASHTSNSSSCYKEHGFLENKLAKRYNAYVEGKGCFQNFVEDHCGPISQDFFKQRFMSIAKSVSTRPTGGNCLDLPHLLDAERCLAMYNILKEETNEATSNKLKMFFGVVSLSEEFDICKETQKCMANNCYFNREPLKKIVDDICDRLSQHV